MKKNIRIFVQAVFTALLINGVLIRFGTLIEGSTESPLLQAFLLLCGTIAFLGGFCAIVIAPCLIEYVIWVVRETIREIIGFYREAA